MPKLFWKISGSLFIVWGVIYESILIHHYGWNQGMYLWLCNLSVVLAGIGLLLESKNLIVALLCPLFLTQSVLLVDLVTRALIGHDLLGLTEELYQPGIRLYEFAFSMHHLFLLPLLIFAAFLLENKKSTAGRWVLGLSLVILPLSYFIFPPEQNINCMHAPCIPDLEHLKGKQYSLIFGILFPLLCMGLARLFTRGPGTRVLSGKNQRFALYVYYASVLASIILSGVSIGRKSKIPSFSCTPPWENADVRIQCRFTTEYIKDWMVLQYRLDNKTRRLRECSSFIEANGKKELLQDGLFIEPASSSDISILIHYPAANSEIQLTANCKP